MVNAIGLPVTVISHGRRFALGLLAVSVPAYVTVGLVTGADLWPIALLAVLVPFLLLQLLKFVFPPESK